jgi:hypothetical protein
MGKLFFYIFFSSLIGGCSTIPSYFSPERVTDIDFKENEGLVILSTGASDSCVSSSTSLHLYNSDSDNVASFSVDNFLIKSDYSTHMGSIHVLKLPEGDYFLTPGIANPYITITESHAVLFSVLPNEILYLGEYFMTVSCSNNSQIVIRDNYDRDIALLVKRNNLFEGLLIKKDIFKIPQN